MIRQAGRLGLWSVFVMWIGVVALSPAKAADIFDRHANAPYDDPRYAYLYGRDDRAPPRGWDRGRDRPDWRETRRGAKFDRADCTPRRVVRRRLQAEGWSGFNNPKVVARRFVEADARHEEGGTYRIVIDRCSGRMVDAYPMGEPATFAEYRLGDGRPYAGGRTPGREGWRRWQREPSAGWRAWDNRPRWRY